MTTRCRPGDLAIILRDDPGYEQNIGRIVEVYGPSRQDPLMGTTWLIVPVTEQPYMVMVAGCKRLYRVRLGHLIEHADAWMIPIRPDQLEGKGLLDGNHIPQAEVAATGQVVIEAVY